jgi:hypothetical protein
VPTNKVADQPLPEDTRSKRLNLLIAVFVFLLVPAAIYGLYVFRQIDDIRANDLRGLDSAAVAAESVLDNVTLNLSNLLKGDRTYACTFFQRQPRLRLVEPSNCKDIAGDTYANASKDFGLDTTGRTLNIVSTCSGSSCLLRIEVVFGTLLEQIPFGAAFEQLLIVDSAGKVLGSAVSPQRTSPMLPPRVPAAAPLLPLRTFSVTSESATQAADATPKPKPLVDATRVQTVAIGGASYALMCQPWHVPARLNVPHDSQGWYLCGLKDAQESFRQALEVAPNVVIVLLVFLTLAVVSWPILKMLSLVPAERIRFSDMYLTLLATLALVMVLSAGVADIAAVSRLHAESTQRLRALAFGIESNLRAEFTHMRDQLQEYDATVADWFAMGASPSEPVLLGCLLLSPERRAANSECQNVDKQPESDDSTLPLQLGMPGAYPYVESVFWMLSCDGQQIVKGTALSANTPVVKLDTRSYFQAVKKADLWPMVSSEGVFVETAASVTTGDFFAALSIPSRLKTNEAVTALADKLRGTTSRPGDCTAEEAGRYAAALTGQPVSVRYPLLAPGVGFAILDQTGKVVFHSDERRAVFENLFADEGVSSRLRAVMAAHADAAFNGYYQTRPHQIYVHAIEGLPWAVMTFADDEVLRTFHVELLGRTAALIAGYWLLALLGTLAYMLFKGRQPPVWMWPRREKRYRELYCATVWGLAAQLGVFLVAVDVLQGLMLALACILLPLAAVVTVGISAMAADRVGEALSAATGSVASIPGRGRVGAKAANAVTQHRLRVGFVIAATVVLVAGLTTAMYVLEPIAAARVHVGVGFAAAMALAVALVASPWLGKKAWQLPVLCRWQEPLAPHIVGSAIVWLLVGALPAYGFFEFALAREETVATKAELAYLARAYAWRACEIAKDFRLIQPPPGAVAARQTLGPGTSEAYWNAYAPRTAPNGGVAGGSPVDAERYWDEYPQARLSKAVEARWTEQSPNDDATPSARAWTLFARYAPIYNETTTYKRYLDPLDPQTRPQWYWSIENDGDPALVYAQREPAACPAPAATFAGRPPDGEPRLDFARASAGLVFLGLLLAWVTFGARKLFFGDIEDDAEASQARFGVHLGQLGWRPDPAWIQGEIAAVTRLSGNTLQFSQTECDEWRDLSTRRQVVDRILARASLLYAQTWRRCDDEEKLLLVQLVEEGFANPKQEETVRRLLAKNLLRRDPVLRPMNYSLAVFVETSRDLEQLKRREKEHGRLRWSSLRGLLLAALVLVLLFLSVTQRETLQVWLAYLTTAAAGTAGVLKLMSFFNRPGVQKAD